MIGELIEEYKYSDEEIRKYAGQVPFGLKAVYKGKTYNVEYIDSYFNVCFEGWDNVVQIDAIDEFIEDPYE